MTELRCLACVAFVLASAAAGCAPKPPAPSGPFIVLDPKPTARAAPHSVASAPAAAIRRDTAALERQARRYVGRPDSKPEVITQLSTLLLQTRRAVERMERNRTHGGYRTPDVTAARVAADGLAAFLQTRTSAAAASPAQTSGFAEPVPVAEPAPTPQPAE